MTEWCRYFVALQESSFGSGHRSSWCSPSSYTEQ